jgi:hypothetical protein
MTLLLGDPGREHEADEALLQLWRRALVPSLWAGNF